MPVRAASLVVDVDADISGALRGLDQVGWRMGLLGRQGEGAALQFARMSSAMTGIGLGLSAAAGAGIAFFVSATRAAIEYNRQSALTLTQVDQLGVKLEDIKKIGLDVAAAIPAPIEQLQESLFDIFSSMDVGLKGAENMLKGFAKAAVAGQTDVQTAGRATIAIMNAYGIQADKVNEVLDFQFQLVRKGVGTYEEFARVIGRAIPSAVRAGQTYQTLGGVLAFLTRNGQSAAMATASAGRAFDAISKTKVGTRLEEMGIQVKGANGEFRQINEIMTDLGKKLEGLSKPEKADVLERIFKGAGGTIQARRFFDLAVTGFDELNQRVDEMNNSAGQMGKAYDIMYNQPATLIQRFKNQLAILRIEIGERFLPNIGKMVTMGEKLVAWFRNLPKGVKDAIVETALFGTLAAGIAGILLTLTGVFLGIAAAISAVTGAGAVLSIMLTTGLLGAFFALPVAIFAVIRNMDELKKVFDKFDAPIDRIGDAFANFFKSIAAAWRNLKKVFTTAGWSEGIISGIPQFFQDIYNAFRNLASGLWDNISDILFGDGKKKIYQDGHRFVYRESKGILDGFIDGLRDTDWGQIFKVIVDRLTRQFERIGRWFNKISDKFDLSGTAQNIGDWFMDVMDKVEWGKVGQRLGRAVGLIAGGLAKFGVKIADAILTLIRSVDWFKVGVAAAVFVVRFLAGVVQGIFQSGLLGDLAGFLGEHLLRIVGLAIAIGFAPAAVTGFIGGALGKIPLVGTFLAWLFGGLGKVGRIIGPWIFTLGRGMIKQFAQGLFGRAVIASTIARLQGLIGGALAGMSWLMGTAATAGGRVIAAFHRGMLVAARGIGAVLWVAFRALGPIFGGIGGWIGTTIAAGARGAAAMGAMSLAGAGLALSLTTALGAALIGWGIGSWIEQNLVKPFIDSHPELDKQLQEWAVKVDAGARKIGNFFTSGLWKGIGEKWGELMDWAWQRLWGEDGLITRFKAWLGISSPSSVMIGVGKDLIQGFWDGAVERWNAFWAWWGGLGGRIVDAIVNFLKELPGKARQQFDRLTTNLHNWFFGTALPWARNTGKGIVEGVVEFLKNLPGRVWDVMLGVGRNIAAGASDVWEKAKAFGKKISDGVIEWVKGIPGKVTGFISDIPGALARLGGSLYEAAKKLAGRLFDGFKKGLFGSPKTLMEYSVIDAFGRMNRDIRRSSASVARSMAKAGERIGESFQPDFGFSGDIKPSNFDEPRRPPFPGPGGGPPGAGAMATGYTGPSMVIENLHVTSDRPSEIAADLGEELVFQMLRVGA